MCCENKLIKMRYINDDMLNWGMDPSFQILFYSIYRLWSRIFFHFPMCIYLALEQIQHGWTNSLQV